MGIVEERRKVLDMVAAGELSPEEASRLLTSLDGRPEEASSRAIEPAAGEIARVRVVGTFRNVRIEGDSSISTATATGPHKARLEEGTMVFEEDPDSEQDGYVIFGPQARRPRRIRISADFGKGRTFRWQNPPAVLHIRMNPELPLEVELTAGSARVWDVTGPIRANLTAGSARFEGVRSPFVAAVEAGSINVSGIFDRGDSEIRCTAGKVRIDLERGSSVKIAARANLGKVALPGGEEWQGIGGGTRKTTVGGGSGTLDIEAVTGAVFVSSK
jgi:hypothetical protein